MCRVLKHSDPKMEKIIESTGVLRIGGNVCLYCDDALDYFRVSALSGELFPMISFCGEERNHADIWLID